MLDAEEPCQTPDRNLHTFMVNEKKPQDDGDAYLSKSVSLDEIVTAGVGLVFT